MTGAPVFFPDRLPQAIRSHPRRGAECRTYDALREQLRGPWHVYYSRPWLGLDRDGRDKEGEADFVLAHPDLGMLVLEVKGGRIRYGAAKDEWTTTNAEGTTIRIKDPGKQATTNKHELLKKLKDRPGWDGRYINACIGVVFPDCAVPTDLAPHLPRHAVAGVTQMPRLGTWVEERLGGGSDRPASGCDPIGEDGLEVLDTFFASSFQLEQPMAATLLQVDSELRLLTERQALILQLLQQHRRLAIPGAAGTGKTSLAVEKARRLAREGLKTLLLCYNRPLMLHLREQVGTIPRLTVANFHGLVSTLSRRAGIPAPGSDDESRLPDDAWSRSLLEALSRLPDERYDAIVVDEGQDLGEGWLPAIDAMLRDPGEGTLYVFYDDNQKVHVRAASIEAGIRRSDLQLNRILRNSRPIATSFLALLPQEIGIDGPAGPPVEFRDTAQPLEIELERLLLELVEQRSIVPEHIVVLFRDVAARNRYVQRGRIGRWEATDSEAVPARTIVCESVRRFKGLEQQVVVLVEPSSFCEEAELLYVGMSRARALLVLLDSAAGLARVRTMLNETR